MSQRFLALTLLLSLFVVACDLNDTADLESGPGLKLNFYGHEVLHNQYHYEAWATIDGQTQSVGKFVVGDEGGIWVEEKWMTDEDGNFEDPADFDRFDEPLPHTIWRVRNNVLESDLDLANASSVTITIEGPDDTDSNPSDVKYLQGTINDNGKATLTASNALGIDVSGAGGSFILNTPTDAADTNETSGVWFNNLTNLPDAPTGWKYEGWVLTSEINLTTGKFTSATGMDEAEPYSGPQDGPAFPGEDFLRNPPLDEDGDPFVEFPYDVRGHDVLITLEPTLDDTTGTFGSMSVLRGNVLESDTSAADGDGGDPIDLLNVSDGLPHGEAIVIE